MALTAPVVHEALRHSVRAIEVLVERTVALSALEDASREAIALQADIARERRRLLALTGVGDATDHGHLQPAAAPATAAGAAAATTAATATAGTTPAAAAPSIHGAGDGDASVLVSTQLAELERLQRIVSRELRRRVRESGAHASAMRTDLLSGPGADRGALRARMERSEQDGAMQVALRVRGMMEEQLAAGQETQAALRSSSDVLSVTKKLYRNFGETLVEASGERRALHVRHLTDRVLIALACVLYVAVVLYVVRRRLPWW